MKNLARLVNEELEFFEFELEELESEEKCRRPRPRREGDERFDECKEQKLLARREARRASPRYN